MKSDEQAMAARLTAIAKRLDSLAAKPTQTYRELDMAADLRFLLAHVETLTQQVAELERQNHIINLSLPLEEDLAAKVDEMCKYLAMEQGFTLAGIARLLIDCQKRMAADWVEIGNERRQRKQAEQENARLTAEIAEAREACPSVRMQDHFDAPLLKLINNEVVRGFKLDSWLADAQKRAEQAEQQRDAAHAALRKAEQDRDAALQDYNDACTSIGRLAELLTGTVNAIRGMPKPLHLHGWSDLPDEARAMKEDRDAARAALKEWQQARLELQQEKGEHLSEAAMARMAMAEERLAKQAFSPGKSINSPSQPPREGSGLDAALQSVPPKEKEK